MDNIQQVQEKILIGSIFDSIEFNKNASDPDRKFLNFDVCLHLPPKISSDGIWANQTHGAFPSASTLSLFEFQILTIFVITQSFHQVFKRLGFPYFVSQIMAGFVLGPSLKGPALWTSFRKFLFPYGSEDTLTLISVYGYTLFLFLNGVQMDFSMITRTGRKAWTIAFASFSIPTVIGLYAAYAYHSYWNEHLGEFDAKNLSAIVIGHSGCSFAVIASLLFDLEIPNSELGRLALSSALVMDVLSTLTTGIGTSVISSIQTDKHNTLSGMGPKQAIESVVKLVVFIVIIPLVARPFMKWFVRRTPEGRPVRKGYTYIVILMAFFLGVVGIAARQSVLAGVLIVGLVVPEGRPLGSELVKQFELFSTWVLLPVFVTCCAMKVDVQDAFHMENLKLLKVMLVIIIVVHFLKMLITIGICHYCKMPKRDGLCLALMLSCKGVVDFCTNIFLFDAMLLSNGAVAVMSLSVLVMGTMARIGVKSLYDPVRKYAGYQRRNILNLKPNSELKIVSCIHKSSHIAPIKNFLDMCCPTPSNPLVVHVLHLMELVGRASPIFISHRLQERISSGHKFSEDVIVTFDLFEHDYAGSASVSTYTAISSFRFMHDDICYLALDKVASIILLPFHVRWAEDGSVESQDENIRSLNAKVLERAPCSVGILVNRGSSSINSTNSKRIAVIFMGGSDDREAMCLAKRTIKECTCDLVVYHLVSTKKDDSTNWDHMLDNEVLKGVMGFYGSVENVTYERVTIENPSEVTPFLSEIADLHDFIIVGRRNGVKSSITGTLDDWTEYSELGVIGDLLASSDTNTKASILVVQQQIMPKS